ncbi:3-alpha-hydroxysteroid dehydrogenase [Sphingobium sp. 22B]|uniref:SDR family NAD(P)-dependent oxidoreductase n=1 Tax=unclassified Sphingobium TaxID=2611147 RepID=UPI000784412F|nr:MULTISPECIES: glucose 1-dehydrogenase [unclassified Sphingobium]KXU33827.1 3-alpha-hydroxysteroid dehydrogenase [Sphingobium sp. AM]KYC33771.1 3-alpha-hydroxysteroid dehydrogenase [Sphingobium sp. 22B]OAP33509.1 3-alpha-hydroxysteroid dehydrogenase [Sphingobium sp. 20006FA]
MTKLNDRIAVITGAARGMGAVTARLFAAEGARVVLADILPEVHDVAAEIGNAALAVTLDVADENSWAELDRRTRAAFGPADILINNAGIMCVGTLVDLELAAFERTLRVNLCGTFLGIKTLAPGMKAGGKGSIVNISSTEGLRGINGMGAYTASKWGVRGLTKSAAMELSPFGIRVNSVHPGPIRTPIALDVADADLDADFAGLPLGRAGEPEEIGRLSLFLASDDASFITGADFTADGGMTAGSYMRFLPGNPPSLASR